MPRVATVWLDFGTWPGGACPPPTRSGPSLGWKPFCSGHTCVSAPVVRQALRTRACATMEKTMGDCLIKPVAATILLLMAGSNPALACSCVQFGPQQLIDSAPVIFSGEVVALERERTPSPYGYGPDQVTATIQVESRWKGAVPERALVHGSDAPAACGWAGYKIGEQVTVLALTRPEANSGNGSLWTNWCLVSLYQKHAAEVDALLRTRPPPRPGNE